MRKISLWAKHHRAPAIVLIVSIKIIVALLAFYLGSTLLKLDRHIPISVLFFSIGTLVIAVLGYPSRWATNLTKNQFYIRQKTCDFTIAASAFLMIATVTNNNLPIPGTAITADTHAASFSRTPTAEEILASLKYRDKSTLTRQEKRILKEEFKKQLKVYVVAKIKGQKDEASKALLIALTVIAAVGLLYLLAALACSLSCNGSDAAAVIVGILGTALIIWGAIALIRRIARGHPRKKEEQATISN